MRLASSSFKMHMKDQKNKTINLRSYAKINLTLDITGVREDGYHLVDTVMQSVDLSDRIDISWDEKEEGEFEIKISSNKPYVPNDERNLAYKAAALMNEYANKPGTLSIHLEKKIPVAAGLAGGSGNGAAVIVGLNKIWKLGFDTKRLCDIGKVLGADVPYCILSINTGYKCARGLNLGDELYPVRHNLAGYVVLAKPAFGVSTKEVYAGMDSMVIENHPDSGLVIGGLKKKSFDDVYKGMGNVLELYTLTKYEGVNDLMNLMKETRNVEKVQMSGSGPTVIGFYRNEYDSKKAALSLRERGYEAYWTKMISSFNKGGKGND